MITDPSSLPETRPPTGTATAELLELELADANCDTAQSCNQLEHTKSGTGTYSKQSHPNGAGQAFSLDQAHSRAQSSAVPAGEVDPADPFVERDQSTRLPGSAGEHLLQSAYGTEQRARRFYDDQVLDHLNPEMQSFIQRMEMAFIATSDARGECDSSLRAGTPGFIEVLDDTHIAYPEYRGNGVMASLGNISENPHVGILMVDFVSDLIGVHVNGMARILEDGDLRSIHPDLPAEFDRGRTPERWVVVQVEEAYIHCRKHIPRMARVDRQRAWGTDEVKRKGGDYFGAKTTSRQAHVNSAVYQGDRK